MGNELTLVTNKQVAGILETNIAELEKYVADKLTAYNPESYDGDVKQAKSDRAELNASKKVLADSRKRIIDEYMSPVRDFENRCKKLEKDIDSVSKNVDEIVKAEEKKEQDAKKKLIEFTYQQKNFDLVSLDKIFNPKWLNKTYKLTDISAEMDTQIAKIYADLQTIEKFVDVSEQETAKAMYLDNLDIGNTLDAINELIKNKSKVVKESDTRAERIHDEKIAEQKVEVRQENESLNKTEFLDSLIGDALGIDTTDTPKEYVISVKVTKQQLLGLKNFLTMQGIVYDNIECLEF